MNDKLSIIVPIYNSGKYLERTVKSILTQRLQDYEILLVDDGSSDRSPVICDKLAAQYKNVRCVHIKNGGPGHARNVGIDSSDGDYIAFCDSDDLPTYNMYGRLLSILKNQDVDMTLCDIYSERDERAFGFPWHENKRMSAGEVVTDLLGSMLGNLSDDDLTQPIWGSSVRCVYKRSIISGYDIRFPEDTNFAEDLVFNVRYISHCKSCYVLNEALYHYTLNPDSIMNSHIRYNPTHFNERLNLVEHITDVISTLKEYPDLSKRFATSQRCYFIESVGNAARAISTHGYRHAYNEICQIVNNPVVKRAFDTFDAKDLKKRLSYSLIRSRISSLLLFYYWFRLDL